MFLNSNVGTRKSDGSPAARPSILLVALLSGLFIFTSACGTPGGKQAKIKDAVVVIFASSGSTVTRANKKLPVTVGMLLQSNDFLQTANGTVDLQTKSGSLVRLRNFSKMRIARLMSDGKTENRFHLKDGGVLARVKRNSSREKFSVVTPTAIAGVRGTVFSVVVDNGKKAKVKVHSGKVAMRPHVPALEKFSKKQIEETPHLKKLHQSLKKKEIVLGAQTEGRLHPRVEKEAAAVHKILERHHKSGVKIKAKSVHQAADKILQHKKAVSSEQKKITPQEDAEQGTLVGVDHKLVSMVITKKETPAPAGSGSNDETRKKELLKITKQIAGDYDKKLGHAVNTVSKKISKKEFKTDDEIRKHYKILEIVRLYGGKKKSGAVVAQAGNILILHTTAGVVQISKKKIEYIDYKHTR